MVNCGLSRLFGISSAGLLLPSKITKAVSLFGRKVLSAGLVLLLKTVTVGSSVKLRKAGTYLLLPTIVKAGPSSLPSEGSVLAPKLRLLPRTANEFDLLPPQLWKAGFRFPPQLLKARRQALLTTLNGVALLLPLNLSNA